MDKNDNGDIQPKDTGVPGTNASGQTLAPVEQAQQEDALPYPDAPEGVGGWLKLLVILLTVIGPLVSFFFHAAEIGKAEALFPDIVNHPAFTQYKHFSWAILLICCIVSIIAGYRLWKYPVRKSVNSAIIALWFIALFPAIAMIVYTWATTGNVWYALAGIAGERWQPLIGAIIWHIYLRRSRRVKNTYR